jgi:hypothetical protein
MSQRDPGGVDHNKVYNIAIAHAPGLLLAVQEALKAFPAPSQ